VPPDVYQSLRHEARIAASNTINNIRLHMPDLALGTSGTIQNLAAVSARTRRDRTPSSENELSLAELRRVTAMLCALPLAERARVPGLNPDRADIIIGGAAILDMLMEELGFESILVATEGGLRDGLLIDYLRQSSTGHYLSVRERSVLRLGRACKFDEAHARNVQRLAFELFDSAKEAGLHDYEAWERELLGHAAMLHDIGAFLSYSSHNVHSSYLIANSDTLLGFYETEITIMSLAALFHRKGLPTTKEPAYAALSKEMRGLVDLLSLLLRLVESLDRTHQGVVDHAQLTAPDAQHLLLNVHAREDVQLELWGIESRRRAVQKTLKRQLKIVLNGQSYETDFATEPPPATPGAD
jgi:exopolyphosphatase/guanosine-5'-triphosphate,3'-diphosphate pyrophosphatase